MARLGRQANPAMRGVVFLHVIACAAYAFATSSPATKVMVKMSDGTALATDYYLPSEGGPKWPVVLARTAYPRIVVGKNAEGWTNDGYACVIQELRGTCASEGERNIFYADGWREGLRDGADAIAWVMDQPWCNGKIATYGESALGITQVLGGPVMSRATCQDIKLAPSDFYNNLAYRGGVWCKNLDETWLTLMGLRDTIHLYKAHPYYDTFWTFYNANAKAPEITLPAIHIGGWYDIFQQGSIDNFVTRQNNGGPGAKGSQVLIMHGGSHVGYHGDYRYSKKTRDVSTGKLEREFIGYWLKGQASDIMKRPPVYYYVMGDDTDPAAPGNEWRNAATWPPYEARETAYYLGAQGALGAEPPAEALSYTFAFDPNNPVPTHGGQNLFLPTGPFDQRSVRDGRKDILVFASAPLETPIEIAGRISVKLFVSTDAPDTDFTAKLVDVYPAGDEREILMLDGVQRVKLRNGFSQPAPLLASPDEVVEVAVDLWSISWVFNTGHRIGLHVSSSNYPRFEINPNTGEDFPQEGNLRIAHNVVHAGKDRPSTLLLPVKP